MRRLPVTSFTIKLECAVNTLLEALQGAPHATCTAAAMAGLKFSYPLER
jgi:hypothetical protein